MEIKNDRRKFALVSFPKSGRTWVRVILSKYQELVNKKFDIVFTHDGSDGLVAPNIEDRKIIYLSRDPRDIVVSYFYHKKYREPPNYQGILSDFIKKEFLNILKFHKKWLNSDSLKITYEQIYNNTYNVIFNLLVFLGEKPEEKKIKESINFGSFANMRELEATNKQIDGLDASLKLYDINNSNSFKARKGKIGSYKEEFSKDDVEYIKQYYLDNGETLYKFGAPSILFFSHSSELGGAERSLVDLIAGFVKRGIICNVILPTNGPLSFLLESKGAVIHIIKTGYSWWAFDKSITFEQRNFLIWQSKENLENEILHIVRKINPDFIYSQTIVYPWGAMYASALGIPHILSVREYGVLDHGLSFHYGFKESMRALYKDSDIIFCNTNDVKRTVFQDFTKNPEFDSKCTVVGSSVSIPDEIDKNIKNRELPDFKKHGRAIKILVMGGICEGKGQLDAVKAVIKIKDKYKVNLSLIGHAQVDYLEKINKEIESNNARDIINIFGFTKNNLEEIINSDILISTSRKEALGRVLFEAALLKTPIIYSNSGGSKEIFTKNVHGLSYEPGDDKDLANKIIEIIEDREKTLLMIENARKYVLERFNDENYIEKQIVSILNYVKENTEKFKTNTSQLVSNIDFEILSGYLKKLLVKKEDEFLYLNKSLQDKNQELQTKDLEIESKDKVIQTDGKKIKDLEQTIKIKEEELDKKDSEIQSKEKDLQIKNSEFDSLESQYNLTKGELLEIQKSKGWRIILILRRIFNYILPTNSLRRKIIIFLLKNIVTITKLFKKGVKWLIFRCTYSKNKIKDFFRKKYLLFKKAIFLYKREGFVIVVKRVINYIKFGRGTFEIPSILTQPEIGKREIFDTVCNFNNERPTLTVFVPFDFRPSNFGGGVRIMNVYKGLSEYFNINLVGLKGYDNNPEKIVVNENLIIYMVPMSREFYEKFDYEQKRLGVPLHDILITNNYNLVPDLVKLCFYLKVESDIFVSSHPYFFKMLSDYCGEKILIYEAHNVDYEIKKSYFKGKKNLDEYLSLVEEVELLACKRADYILAVSDNDIKNLHKKYTFNLDKIIKVPNGIDVDSYKFINQSPLILKNRRNIIFVGSAHAPNFEAVDFILEELAPRNKNYNYIIIGNINSHYKTKKIPKNVRFTGVVTDNERTILYENCDLVINPMFSGSGTNLKVLEYAAYGIPLVSTKFGMRGLEVLNDYIYVVEKDGFFKEIERVFSLSFEVKNKNSVLARRICEKYFDKSVIVLGCVRKVNEIFLSGIINNYKNIAIEGRILHRNVSGTERYISEIVKNISSIKKDINYNYLLVNCSNFNSLKTPLIPCVSTCPKVDLYHRTYQFGSPFELAESLMAERRVFTFLDLILCHNPNYFPNKEDHEKFVSLMRLSLYFSNRIIAISEHAKKDLIKTFNVPDKKIDVVYLGIDTDKFKKNNKAEIKIFRDRYKLPSKYLLYVGSDYPHKNLKNLLNAFSQIITKKETADYFLVIVGNNYYNEVNKYINNGHNTLKERIIFLGHFNDNDISLLYSAADIFIFPSLYEGFGLPVLEAFACELPVICSNATSLPEVAGDAAYSVNAENHNEITKAIIDIIKKPKLREDLIKKGKKRVKQFTWERCAEETLSVYKKVLDENYINKNSENLKILKEEFKGVDLSKFKFDFIKKNTSICIQGGGVCVSKKIKLAVLFLEYNNGKYKNSFESLHSYIDKIDNCEKEYFIIDNMKEGNYCHRVSKNTYRIGGNNSDWEFSGWQKGIDFLNKEKIDYDVILFVNDAFMAYGWSLLQKGITSRSLNDIIRDNFVVGHIDTKGYDMNVLGHSVKEWVCTNCFFVPRKIVQSIDTIVSIDDKTLLTIVPEKYLEDNYYCNKAPLDENYKKMAVNWLTKEWHGKFEINKNTWGLFCNKLKAMINESLLTVKIIDLGYKVESYKKYTHDKNN